MNKLIELSIVLPLGTPPDLAKTSRPCDCCGESTVIGKLACVPGIYESKTIVSWICPACLPEVKSTGGENIQRGTEIKEEQIDSMLLSAAEWFDSSLLKRNKFEPYVRRPLFAEIRKALDESKMIPDGTAIVVMRQGTTQLRRQVLSFPFPWESDSEFITGPAAAREALAMEEEVKRGNVEVSAFGASCFMTATPEAMDRIQRAGGRK